MTLTCFDLSLRPSPICDRLSQLMRNERRLSITPLNDHSLIKNRELFTFPGNLDSFARKAAETYPNLVNELEVSFG